MLQQRRLLAAFGLSCGYVAAARFARIRLRTREERIAYGASFLWSCIRLMSSQDSTLGPWQKSMLRCLRIRIDDAAPVRASLDIGRLLRHCATLDIGALGDGVAVDIGPYSVLESRVSICGCVRIERNVFINEQVRLAGGYDGKSYVHIAQGALIGPRVMIETYSHPARLDPTAPLTTTDSVRIGRYTWLGAGVIVTPGVTVSDFSTVAAGAIVTRDVEPFTLVAGCPAVIKKRLDAVRHFVITGIKSMCEDHIRGKCEAVSERQEARSKKSWEREEARGERRQTRQQTQGSRRKAPDTRQHKL